MELYVFCPHCGKNRLGNVTEDQVTENVTESTFKCGKCAKSTIQTLVLETKPTLDPPHTWYNSPAYW